MPGSSRCTREQAQEVLRREIELRAEEIAHYLDMTIPRVLKRHGLEWSEAHPGAFDEVARLAAKDLEKLAVYQNEKIDRHKQIGYVCFWIRKLKPIKVALRRDGGAEPHVNELLSIWLGCELLISHVEGKVGGNSARQSTAEAIIARIRRFMADNKAISYLVHCMRVRTFGPHNYVIMLNQFTWG